MYLRLSSILVVSIFPVALIGQTAPEKPLSEKSVAGKSQLLVQSQSQQNSPGYNRYKQYVMTILMSPTYQKELELSNEQVEQVKKLRTQMTDGYKEIYARYPELADRKLDYKKRGELYKKLQAEYSELRGKIEQEILEQLVPNQKTILTRLQFAQAIRIYGFSATLTKTDFAKQLELTEKQQAELERIKRETESEIQKLMEAKRKAGKEKMLKVLNAGQRKKVRELEGDAKPATYTRL